MKPTPRLLWWSGFLTATCITSLYQNLMGREDYAKHILEHWITPWITIPLAIIGLIICQLIWSGVRD